VLPSIRAERDIAAAQQPEITKLRVVNLGETEVGPDSEQLDVPRKRESGYVHGSSNRVLPGVRFRFRSRGQVASRIPARLSRPFAKYGPPGHSNSGSTAHSYHGQRHRNRLQQQHHVGQSLGIDGGLTQQGIPSPIRNVDFAVANPIADQNSEPFGMHTANYLPPQNQKLPAYSSTDSFTPQSIQNLVDHHQISDATQFLSENAHAIQQLYGAPASNQDFAPGNEAFQIETGNRIPSDQFGSFESTLQSPQEFRAALPSYASGTLSAHETLEQIQSLEKDRLIVQLQQALARTQGSPTTASRYAQNQVGLVQNQDFLASISQHAKSHVSTTPHSFGFAAENAFSQSPFLPGTTINPLGQFPFNYGVPTTARTPSTTTTTTTTTVAESPSSQIPQSPEGDSTSQVASSQPAPGQPGSPAAPVSPVGVPIYGGFVPTIIAGTSLIPSYATSVFTPVRPVQPASGTSPTHFGIPIPTETSGKPDSGSPSTTTPSSFKPSPANQPGLALTPAITPVALPIRPVQPIRPVAAPLHPLATHPVIANPLHPVLPVSGTAQGHPVQASTPAVTSSVQHTYGVQGVQINPAVYKPLKAVYPVYYYPNVAYQLQKPALLPSYPWSYAPSYAQTKPAQIWKWGPFSSFSSAAHYVQVDYLPARKRERKRSKKKVRRGDLLLRDPNVPMSDAMPLDGLFYK